MKEQDIRPKDIFDRYLALCEQDTKTYFSEVQLADISCPACSAQGEHAFIKSGFAYRHCPDCYTLFVSPRPPAEAFVRYYRDSQSSKFWASTFYKETAESRREKIWKPKARMIWDKLERFKSDGFPVVDIGGGYGIFAEEMSKLTQTPVTVVEPAPHLAAVCRCKGLSVIENFLDQVDPRFLPAGAKKTFVSFELFEHLHDCGDFLYCLRHLMGPEDLFIFTTLSGLGIDIVTLWDRSKSVSPPHHLNFFNPYSIELLLQRHGFQALDISTPGKLDVDLLCTHARGSDRFWNRFHRFATEETKQRWQDLIADTNWSSHMMVVCRRFGS